MRALNELFRFPFKVAFDKQIEYDCLKILNCIFCMNLIAFEWDFKFVSTERFVCMFRIFMKWTAQV